MKTKIIKVLIVLCGIAIGILATFFLSGKIANRREKKSYLNRAIDALETIANEEKEQTKMMEKNEKSY